MNNSDSVSLDEVWEQTLARQKVELPWTQADEERLTAKREKERKAREEWEKNHPQVEEEEQDTEDEQENEE